MTNQTYKLKTDSQNKKKSFSYFFNLTLHCLDAKKSKQTCKILDTCSIFQNELEKSCMIFNCKNCQHFYAINIWNNHYFGQNVTGFHENVTAYLFTSVPCNRTFQKGFPWFCACVMYRFSCTDVEVAVLVFRS